MFLKFVKEVVKTVGTPVAYLCGVNQLFTF